VIDQPRPRPDAGKPESTNESSQIAAVVGGTIIDGNGGAPIKDGVILISGGRIIAIGDRSVPVPPHARRILAHGKYVIPGLMDANVHLVFDLQAVTLIRYEDRYDELATEAAQIALKNGVTTVFDSWGPRRYLVKARNAINEGQSVGSRIFLAGNIVGLDGPYSVDFFPELADAVLDGFAQQINSIWQENVGRRLLWMSPEQVRAEMRSYVKREIDFVKYAVSGHPLDAMEMIQFSPRVQRVIVEESHRAGLTVQTHTTSTESLRLAVEAGVDLLQHGSLTGPECIPEDTLALMVERQVPCAILAFTTNSLAWFREKAKTAPWAVMYGVADLNEKALMRAGANILMSTDGGVISRNTKSGAHYRSKPSDENLEELGEGHFHWFVAVEQKGMKAMDALMAATRNIARAYKVDRDLGTLEAGKIADLLILDKNPLDSALNYRSISLVMKDGRIVDTDALPTRRLLTAESDAPAQCL
jgi:imidazolonepropionase-like amidohydrolase